SALTRASTVLLGCAGIAWGLLVLPNGWRSIAIERMSGAIIAGEAFRPDVIDAQLERSVATVSGWCRPASVRSAAILRLALWEDAVSQGQRELIDPRIGLLRVGILRALGCSPAEPYRWLVLFTVDSSRTGFDPRYLAYLRLSYQLGPNEGWISQHRL